MRPPFTCVYREIWDDEKYWSMSEIGRLIYFYIISAPLGNGLGCFKAGIAAMTEESRLESKRFTKGFDEGLAKGLYEYNEKHRVILIPRYFERNPPSNPNGIIAMSKEYIKIPDCELKAKCFHTVREWCESRTEGFKERFKERFKEPRLNDSSNHLVRIPPSPSPSNPPSNTMSATEKLADELCDLLLSEIQKENPTSKAKKINSWVLDMEKILRIDDRIYDQVKDVIMWSTHHEFWRSNVLSPGKLRIKFDQIILQMKPNNTKPKPPPPRNFGMNDWS